MNANIFVATLLLLFLGCTQQQSDQMTQQQKDQVKSEVKAVVDSLTASFQRLDMNACLSYYWDSPDFVMYSANGSRSDYQTLKKTAFDFAGSVADFKISWDTPTIRVAARDFAVCTLIGKSDVTFKPGDKMKEDPDVLTMIFMKIDGRWKVVYSAESETVTTQKAGKK